MIDPFETMLMASRMVRQGRPLSAAMALMFPSASPSGRKSRSTGAKWRARLAKPARPVPGSFVDGRFVGSHGAISYKFYTPKGARRRRLPMVVMLHGCNQTANEFAVGTAMNRLADVLGFFVLYPEQSGSANMARCWNWHNPEHQRRDAGEPALIAGVTRRTLDLCGADPQRIYIAGLSAGGCAAAAIAALYPDLYAAVGVHSAMAPGNVSTIYSAISAMRSGDSGGTGRATRPCPTIVFHGDRDDVVNPSAAAGFLSLLERSEPGVLTRHVSRNKSRRGRNFTRATYRDRSGDLLLEDWTVHGSGHAWSGGDGAAQYTDPAGPDASREMMRFFLEHGRKRPRIVRR